MTQIIDGKLVAQHTLDDLRQKLAQMTKKPSLAVIIVGEDSASRIYVNLKKKKALELNMHSSVIEFPQNITQNELLNKIEELNNDKSVNAILVQLPLPRHIDTKAVLEKISPEKDVDCFHPFNVGKITTAGVPPVYPCTPKGIMRLLDFYKISVSGKNAVVVGRSNIVGRPVAQMLLNADATVTVCHSKTQNLAQITKTADILVVAAGHAKLIKKEMVKDGAIVVDVGMNRDENGKLCGDVDFEAVKEKAAFITPVPGGVGPMTIATLMTNTFDLFEKQ